MFSTLGSGGGTIQNVELGNALISINCSSCHTEFVGILVGNNLGGTIFNSFAIGIVNNLENNQDGKDGEFVGSNNGQIFNGYADVNVNANSSVDSNRGFVRFDDGSILNSYATTRSGSAFIGGFFATEEGTYINGYYAIGSINGSISSSGAFVVNEGGIETYVNCFESGLSTMTSCPFVSSSNVFYNYHFAVYNNNNNSSSLSIWNEVSGNGTTFPISQQNQCPNISSFLVCTIGSNGVNNTNFCYINSSYTSNGICPTKLVLIEKMVAIILNYS